MNYYSPEFLIKYFLEEQYDIYVCCVSFYYVVVLCLILVEINALCNYQCFANDLLPEENINLSKKQLL